MTISREDYDRLVEIRVEMLERLEEARRIVRRTDRQVYERAQAYAFGWIDSALDSGNPYDIDYEDILNSLTIKEDEEESLVEETP